MKGLIAIVLISMLIWLFCGDATMDRATNGFLTFVYFLGFVGLGVCMDKKHTDWGIEKRDWIHYSITVATFFIFPFVMKLYFGMPYPHCVASTLNWFVSIGVGFLLTRLICGK